MALPAGKLPPELLGAILDELPARGPEVVVGATVGEDASVLDIGGRYLVLAADPVTLSTEPGSYAVQVNANDIAVMGAEPRWLLATVLLPEGAVEEDARRVMRDLQRACAQLGVALIGGHTEITPTVTQPVVAATMVGEVVPERLVRSVGARPGDALLLAGPIAVEGTAILAGEFGEELHARGVPAALIEEGRGLFAEPGISVVPAARALMDAVLPHAMHDPTEGGLRSAVWELGTAAGAGVRLDGDAVPIIPACRAICAALELDSLALLASGSLLAALAPEDVQAAHAALGAAGIESSVVGEILPRLAGFILRTEGRDSELILPARDELARWIEGRSHSRGAAR
jgi:hydrogenase maturation factor